MASLMDGTFILEINSKGMLIERHFTGSTKVTQKMLEKFNKEFHTFLVKHKETVSKVQDQEKYESK